MSKLTKIILVAFVLLVIGVWIDDHYFSPKSQDDYFSYIESGHALNVVMIDFYAQSNFEQQAFLDGQNAILVIHKGLSHREDTILTPAMLVSLDANRDGVVDAGDNRYKDLELFYMENGAAHFVPLAQSGIRVIYLKKSLDNSLGSVLLADGSKRFMRSVQLYETPQKSK